MSWIDVLTLGGRVFFTDTLLYKYVFGDYYHKRTLHRKSGTSGGHSYIGYDIHIAIQDLYADTLERRRIENSDSDADIALAYGGFLLGVSVEHFRMPKTYYATVHDKSTLARLGLAVQNTIIEPGWKGFLTLELTNHNASTHIGLYDCQPIAQIVFNKSPNWFWKWFNKGYDGKYNNQGARPVEAIFQ